MSENKRREGHTGWVTKKSERKVREGIPFVGLDTMTAYGHVHEQLSLLAKRSGVPGPCQPESKHREKRARKFTKRGRKKKSEQNHRDKQQKGEGAGRKERERK